MLVPTFPRGSRGMVSSPSSSKSSGSGMLPMALAGSQEGPSASSPASSVDGDHRSSIARRPRLRDSKRHVVFDAILGPRADLEDLEDPPVPPPDGEDHIVALAELVVAKGDTLA